MKPATATIWGHAEDHCAAEDCDEAAETHGLCDWHDQAESDAVAEQLMEMHRDDPL